MKELECPRTAPYGGLGDSHVSFEAVLSDHDGCVDLLLGMIKEAFFVTGTGA
jgi:hypothetical protein